MNFNKFLQSLFGNKSTRDMKLIQPLVESVKAVYPEIKKLSNDELRARTKEIQAYVQNSAKEQKDQIEALKAKIEDTPIDERESIFNEIDKLEKEVLKIYEKALDEVMPVAFSIVKDTARRFAENEETVVTATDFDRELAADPIFAPLLLGMGVTEFSMSAKSVSEIKFLLRKVPFAKARALRDEILTLSRSRHIASRLRSFHYEALERFLK